MNSCIFIIFGITGDLAKRKLIPALAQLIADNKIDQFAVVGAAIDQTTSDAILDNARPYAKNIRPAAWKKLHESFTYHQLDFEKQTDFENLAIHVADVEKKQDLPGNRLCYLAAPSHFFCTITHNTARAGLITKKTTKDSPWHRIVYEKPFGHDRESAHEINECIAESLNEQQVYRIDHYLTKELVSNISLVRFTNCVFEPLWNNRYIDQVQIIVSEKLCVDGRGTYYDAYGAMRDVVQNHMIELLALIAMESPEQLSGDYIRKRRARVIQDMEVTDGILGQYDTYHKERGVAPGSKTETFAALRLAINNPRWTGVPFYFRTGKCLDKHESVIHIKFKQVDCLLARNCPSDSNWLTISIAPDASFSLQLNAKKPREPGITPIKMDFCHSCLFGPLTPQAYEVLLEEIIRGEQSIAVRFDEIEYAWNIIDAAYKMNLPCYPYPSGSSGPEELKQFNQKHGIRWRS